MRRSIIVALLTAACVPVGPPPGPPPAALAADEPVAFLLTHRDSLGLAEDTANELVRLNTRLFRRNQPLRFVVDTILEHSGHRRQDSRAAQRPVSPAVQERIEPLLAQIRANSEAMADTALSLLSETQRARARMLMERARSTPLR